MEEKGSISVNDSNVFGALLLDIGSSLLQAGATISRIRTAMTRLAAAYHYVPRITIWPKSVSLILNDKAGNVVFNDFRTITVPGTDFTQISEISRLSKTAAESGWTVPELSKQLTNSRQLGHYPRLIILSLVSLAGGAFCYTFGGTYIEMMITFGGTFCGLFVKQQMTRSNLNPYICTYVAAAVASLFVGLFHVTGLTVSPVNAFSTCVLFLVPGVLFINSFTDLIDGNTINGISRMVNALLHTLAIALGLLTIVIILNLRG